MSRGTVNVFLVGMRFHDFSAPSGKSIDADRLKLVREPLNPYDTNAISIQIMGQIAGHLDRQSALKLAPLIDGGARCSVASFNWDRSAKSIPVSVRVETGAENIPVPTLSANFAGIYRITIKGVAESYVGQSRHIVSRIKSHWNELNVGIHSNPALMERWNVVGGRAFAAVVVERAPENLSNLELSNWLSSRESYWINRFDREKGVLNFDAPTTVLVGEDREVARQNRLEERERNRIASERRALLCEQISQLRKLCTERHDQLTKVQKIIRENRGLRGLLFGNETSRRALPNHVASERQLRGDIETLTCKIDALYKAISVLPSPPLNPQRRLNRSSRRSRLPWS